MMGNHNVHACIWNLVEVRKHLEPPSNRLGSRFNKRFHSYAPPANQGRQQRASTASEVEHGGFRTNMRLVDPSFVCDQRPSTRAKLPGGVLSTLQSNVATG